MKPNGINILVKDLSRIKPQPINIFLTKRDYNSGLVVTFNFNERTQTELINLFSVSLVKIR